MTVEQLRKELEDLPSDLPVMVWVSDTDESVEIELIDKTIIDRVELNITYKGEFL